MLSDKKKKKGRSTGALRIPRGRTAKQKERQQAKGKTEFPPKMEIPRTNGDQPPTELSNREGEEWLLLALEVAKLRIWDWDFQADRTTWYGIREQAFGFSPGTFKGAYKAILNAVHPLDREKFRRTVTRAIEESKPLDLEYRIVRKEGDVRWLWTQARMYRDRSGRKERMIGVSQDITERKEEEERLQLTQFATEALSM
jgi:PAS domain S-box-containing protein